MMRTLRLLPVLLALLAAGCGTSGQREPEPQPVQVAPPVAEPRDPVDELLSRAARSPADRAADLRLEAASRLLARGDSARALEAVAPLAGQRLAPLQGARHAWVLARVDLARGQPRRALARLSTPEVQANAGADRGLQVDVARTRAEALLATGQHMQAAREGAALQPWLVTDAERDANARAILTALARVPLHDIATAVPAAGAEDWAAWLELALVVRDMTPAPAAQRQRLAGWRTRYGTLPALDTASRVLLPEVESRIANPSRIALLLPLSGRNGASGQAVLQGYLAERYLQVAAAEPPPPVAVIDTAAEPGGFSAAYRRAVDDGATLVVGPLLKEELAAFGGELQPRVPTLALNFLDEKLPAKPQLSLFGIDARDELQQLVAAARGEGLGRVMILADNSERARRLAEGFQQDWKAAAGETLGTLYLGDLNEYRSSLEQSLLLEQSAQRGRALQQLLGLPLATEPRRRADLDLFVLFAEPAGARSIRSLLTYLYAGDVPVWATSLSRPAEGADQGNLDLEGLRFLDMPWYTAQEDALRTAAAVAVQPGAMERLAALGADAARLQSRLGLFDSVPGAGLAGASGELSRDADGRIRRQSDWFVIEQGRARAWQAGAAAVSTSTEGDGAWTQTGAAAPPAPDTQPNNVP